MILRWIWSVKVLSGFSRLCACVRAWVSECVSVCVCVCVRVCVSRSTFLRITTRTDWGGIECNLTESSRSCSFHRYNDGGIWQILNGVWWIRYALRTKAHWALVVISILILQWQMQGYVEWLVARWGQDSTHILSCIAWRKREARALWQFCLRHIGQRLLVDVDTAGPFSSQVFPQTACQIFAQFCTSVQIKRDLLCVKTKSIILCLTRGWVSVRALLAYRAAAWESPGCWEFLALEEVLWKQPRQCNSREKRGSEKLKRTATLAVARCLQARLIVTTLTPSSAWSRSCQACRFHQAFLKSS